MCWCVVKKLLSLSCIPILYVCVIRGQVEQCQVNLAWPLRNCQCSGRQLIVAKKTFRWSCDGSAKSTWPKICIHLLRVSFKCLFKHTLQFTVDCIKPLFCDYLCCLYMSTADKHSKPYVPRRGLTEPRCEEPAVPAAASAHTQHAFHATSTNTICTLAAQFE